MLIKKSLYYKYNIYPNKNYKKQINKQTKQKKLNTKLINLHIIELPCKIAATNKLKKKREKIMKTKIKVEKNLIKKNGNV